MNYFCNIITSICFDYWDFLTNFWRNNCRSIIDVVERLCSYVVNSLIQVCIVFIFFKGGMKEKMRKDSLGSDTSSNADKKLQNQFSFVERATQTMNNSLKVQKNIIFFYWDWSKVSSIKPKSEDRLFLWFCI